MNIYGIDFSSAPTKSKPLTCLECKFDSAILDCVELRHMENLDLFESFLKSQGPWVSELRLAAPNRSRLQSFFTVMFP